MDWDPIKLSNRCIHLREHLQIDLCNSSRFGSQGHIPMLVEDILLMNLLTYLSSGWLCDRNIISPLTLPNVCAGGNQIICQP